MLITQNGIRTEKRALVRRSPPSSLRLRGAMPTYKDVSG
jgi:hypothetical protein